MRVERKKRRQTPFLIRRFGTLYLDVALQLRQPEIGEIVNAIKVVSFLFIDIGNPERVHEDSPACFYPAAKTIAVIFGFDCFQLRARRSRKASLQALFQEVDAYP